MRKRGGNKDTKKKRKRQKREDDLLRAKKAGLKLPSLKEALAAAQPGKRVTATATLAQPQQGSSPFLPAAARSSSSSAPAPSVPTQAAAPQASAPAAVAAAGSAPADDASVPGAGAPAGQERGQKRPLHDGAPPPAATAATAPSRPVATYGDVDDDATVAANAMLSERLTKETMRRARVAQSQNRRTVFVTNVSFQATEPELRACFGKGGTIQYIKFARDKATTKFLGYVHVVFETVAMASACIDKCNKHELHNRIMYVMSVGEGDKFQFELPEELREELKSILREGFEGKNLSTIKDAWEKRHNKKKLNTSRWGFKNFSRAMKSIEGLTLEIHTDKKLTNLPFFKGSPAHVAFLEEQRRKKVE